MSEKGLLSVIHKKIFLKNYKKATDLDRKKIVKDI